MLQAAKRQGSGLRGETLGLSGSRPPPPPLPRDPDVSIKLKTTVTQSYVSFLQLFAWPYKTYKKESTMNYFLHFQFISRNCNHNCPHSGLSAPSMKCSGRYCFRNLEYYNLLDLVMEIKGIYHKFIICIRKYCVSGGTSTE